MPRFLLTFLAFFTFLLVAERAAAIGLCELLSSSQTLLAMGPDGLAVECSQEICGEDPGNLQPTLRFVEIRDRAGRIVERHPRPGTTQEDLEALATWTVRRWPAVRSEEEWAALEEEEQQVEALRILTAALIEAVLPLYPPWAAPTVPVPHRGLDETLAGMRPVSAPTHGRCSVKVTRTGKVATLVVSGPGLHFEHALTEALDPATRPTLKTWWWPNGGAVVEVRVPELTTHGALRHHAVLTAVLVLDEVHVPGLLACKA